MSPQSLELSSSSLVSPPTRTTVDFREARNFDFVDFCEARDLSPLDVTLLDCLPPPPPTPEVQTLAWMKQHFLESVSKEKIRRILKMILL